MRPELFDSIIKVITYMGYIGLCSIVFTNIVHIIMHIIYRHRLSERMCDLNDGLEYMKSVGADGSKEEKSKFDLECVKNRMNYHYNFMMKNIANILIIFLMLVVIWVVSHNIIENYNHDYIDKHYDTMTTAQIAQIHEEDYYNEVRVAQRRSSVARTET